MTEYNYLELERAGMFMEDGHSKTNADLMAERALIKSAAAEMAYKKTIQEHKPSKERKQQ